MIKKWNVTCEVNMCAEKEITVTVKANTERKAKEMAEKKLYKDGYFHVKLLRCKEVT